VTRSASPKLGAYAALTGAGLIAALVLGRPELAALAAPFALFLAAGLALAEPPEVRTVLDLAPERQIEGDPVEVELNLQSPTAVPRLELLLDLPPGLVAETPNPQVLRLEAGERREIDHTVRCSSSSRPSTTGGRSRCIRAASRSGGCCGRSRLRRSRETSSRGAGATGSSSPTCGSSCPVTASAG
jgi:uncharacterized protein (DUF58 family)